MSYDPQNIFAKILRGEIPSKVIYEDQYVMVIEDAFPQAKVHALVLPRDSYVSMTDFTSAASDDEILALNRAVAKTVEILDLAKSGYRVIANTGIHGGQEIPHLHLHILGGERLGKMLGPKD